MRKSQFIGNPFIKPKNRTWQVESPPSLSRPISPPPLRGKPTEEGSENGKVEASQDGEEKPSQKNTEKSELPSASVEAGEVRIDDHLTYFTTKLSSQAKSPSIEPNLPISKFVDLYKRNQNSSGHHFVIHQHDHPIAGVHYDLRLQISKSSSISFAIMYGLPGNANSKRLARNATETRVHNLWVSHFFPVTIS